MSLIRIIILTLIALTAFAGNSLFCRAALRDAEMDAASFTTIRLISGALILYVVTRASRGSEVRGNWLSAWLLFLYAAGFSYAYVNVSAGTGALLLFGAVQVTMIGHGLRSGERLQRWQVVGLGIALTGLIGLLLPGLSAPSISASVLMLGAGVAWGIYSLRGKGVGDPIGVTAGNFIRTIPMVVGLSLIMWQGHSLSAAGVGYAVGSGALASGMGYAIWYTVLPALKVTQAATVQLSVPVIAAVGGVIFLSEPMGLRIGLASLAILGGISLVILKKQIVNDRLSS